MKGAKGLEASINNLSEDELLLEVERAKQGDKNAFCNLININKSAIYRVSKAILNKEETIIKEEQVLRVFKVMETAYKSAKTNEVIKEII